MNDHVDNDVKKVKEKNNKIPQLPTPSLNVLLK